VIRLSDHIKRDETTASVKNVTGKKTKDLDMYSLSNPVVTPSKDESEEGSRNIVSNKVHYRDSLLSNVYFQKDHNLHKAEENQQSRKRGSSTWAERKAELLNKNCDKQSDDKESTKRRSNGIPMKVSTRYILLTQGALLWL
jgi:hypothetical protein